MKREFLKNLGIEALTDEVIEKIMSEHGKYVKSITDKLETANSETTDWKTKYGEVEKTLKQFEGVDVENLKGEITKLRGEIQTNQKNYETERAKDKRIYETNEFLSGYKFVNDYTKKAFTESLNAALEDKANEGKNRKDIFDTLIKDKDGKELENVFVKEESKKPSNPNEFKIPNGALPPSGNAPAIIDKNPFDKKTFNLSEQVKLFKENPTAAREMAGKAGYKLPE